MTSHSPDIPTIYRDIVDCQNNHNWDQLSRLVAPTIQVNGHSQSREEFIKNIESRKVHRLKASVDAILYDKDAHAISARLVNRHAQYSSTEETIESLEIILAWFTNGRLSRVFSLRDTDPTIETAPNPRRRLRSSTSLDLKRFYNAYISSINEHTMPAEFDKFCQPTLTHNDRNFPIPQYIDLIKDSQNAIRNLYFDVKEILIDKENGQITSRIEFTGTPVKEWANAKPTGKDVRFHEHAMYWLDDGNIARVLSVIDLEAYRSQLRGDE